MAVFGGDVGLDEFAKHQNAEKLWETAQGRTTWGYDLGVWSAHNGTDTLFYQFAQEARGGKGGWSYYRVTMEDAVALGLVEKINSVRGTKITRAEFIQDCKTAPASRKSTSRPTTAIPPAARPASCPGPNPALPAGI